MNDTTQLKQTQTAEQEIDLIAIAVRMMMHWRWFLLSVTVCLIAALAYLYVTPGVYKRTSAILVKDNGRSNIASTLLPQIQGMGLSGGAEVDNELFLLKSQRLMEQVVADLELHVRYTARENLRRIDLYTQTPVNVRFLEPDNNSTVSMRVRLDAEQRLTLSGFTSVGAVNLKVEESELTAMPSDTVSTPIGRLVLAPTLFFGTGNHKTITIERVPVNVKAAELRAILDIVPASKKGGTVVELSVQDVCPRRAEDLLVKLMEVYQEDEVSSKLMVTELSRRFLDERLQVIEGELGIADFKVQYFKERNRLVDVENQTILALNETSKQQNEIFMLENQISLVGYMLDYLAGENQNALIPVNVGINDQRLNALIADYNETMYRKNELLQNSNERNPAIRAMSSALAAKFAGIRASVEELKRQLVYNLAQMKVRDQLSQGSISAVPGKQNAMASITRQQVVKEQLYLFLLNKKEENDLSAVITNSNARVVEYPYGTATPTAPRRMMVLAAAMLIGLFIPAGMVLLKQMADTRVRNRKDIEGRIEVPVYGEIPLEPLKNKPVMVRPEGRDQLSEAFRILRTNMHFMNVSGTMKVFLITSTNIASGKSFFAANMAATLAMGGKRVLLIDADLRKRSLSKRLGHDAAQRGLSSYLAGMDETVSHLIKKEGTRVMFDLLPAGQTPPNPAELLMGERLVQLIEALKALYDYILIDSTPSMVVTDAMVTARVADHTFYVMREGLMPLALLPDVQRLYEKKQLPNMGIVLNAVRKEHLQYGYGYGYENEDTLNFVGRVHTWIKRVKERNNFVRLW